MADTRTATFDYTTLPATDRITVQNCAEQVHNFIRKATRDTHAIGLKLRAVKKVLGHGRFLTWVKTEFEWSADTAERLMKVAERFTEIPHGAEIGQAALYLLAGNGVPEEARREALDRAAAGEVISKSVARTIVDNHRVPKNGSTGEGAVAACAPAASEQSAAASAEPPLASPSDTDGPAESIVAEPTVAPAGADDAIPQEIDADPAGVQGTEKPVVLHDLDILIIAAWSLVESGDTDIGPAVRRTVRGWPAERRAELARQAGAFGRHMTAASALLARPPRPARKSNADGADRGHA